MRIQWVALDWGTTNLSAYAVGDGNQIVDRIESNMGMSQLLPGEFEPTLLAIIEPWLSNDRVTPVVACGMVGAKQGWVEAPYSEVPCLPVSPERVVSVFVKDPRLSVRIVPGVCQRQPEDVMRGEETQIAGYLAENPNFNGVFCLPGTHSKWVQVEKGEIRSFTTFMTGELFGLLANHSVLRFCTKSPSWDGAAFLGAIETAFSDPSGITAKLFSLRPQALLNGTPNEVLKARLSGLLIGAEIAAVQDMWRNRDVVIIGDRENARLYQIALEACGMCPHIYDDAQAIIQGMRSVVQISTMTTEAV
ncbi:2-dehydro-3-deoxygalactonokinase [uncultured Pelagimonas sp.]|uniref:2-dehydro-3-deoxygalactonokinase n=1 Tax=uncultured Pelagimonas sp. TaxID=1618102 RepID=UPI00261457EE|nr:2-dehydro-3-deoxygalactonokinase [uncultured Pelagimonas sp.]